MVRCYCLMSKMGNSKIQGRGPEQNPQYRQISRTVYINNKRQLGMCYVYNKRVIVFVPRSIKCVFLINRFPQLSVRRRTDTVDNGQHSVLAVPNSSATTYAAYVTTGVATLRCYNTDRTTFVTHISLCVTFVDACHPSKLCPKLKRRGR